MCFNQFFEGRNSLVTLKNPWMAKICNFDSCNTDFPKFILYNSNLLKNPNKFRTDWLGPYIVNCITAEATVLLQKLDGTHLESLVNGSWLKPYRDSRTSFD